MSTFKDLCTFANANRYTIHIHRNERILGPGLGANLPPAGTEISVKNIPQEVFEHDIHEYFAEMGNIYKIRLTMLPNGTPHAGTAFVTFDTTLAVKRAILFKNNTEIRPGYTISIKKSNNTRTLLLGGIPDHLRKYQIWNELMRIGLKSFIKIVVYRSLVDVNRNTGFVFLEFATRPEARMGLAYCEGKHFFGMPMYADWAIQVTKEGDVELSEVKRLYIKNLSVYEDRSVLLNTLREVLGERDCSSVEKVFRYRDYAFVHFKKVRHARKAFPLLKKYYERFASVVEVSWTIPIQEEYIGPEELY